MKHGMILAAIAVVVMSAGAVKANDQKNGVQLGWGGGSYSLNYERLFGGVNGVIAEGFIAPDDDGSGMGGGVGYRWHWSEEKGLGSGFMGLMVKYSSFSGEDALGNDMKATIFSVVPNIGKRWIIGPGVSVVARVGYGYANASFDYTNVGLVDDMFEKLVEFVGAFDGEFSIGYSF